MKKSQLLKFIVIFFIFLFLNTNISAVGIVHGDDTVINFEPNIVKNISFTLRNIKSGTYLNLSLSGDLAKYANISEVNNLGNFTITLKLPNEIKQPGTHTILISAEEIPDNSVKGTIMAVTAAKVPILIKVPYPGKYIEANLNIQDVNIGEPVNFIISIINLGEQDIMNVKASIEIYNPEGKKIETISTEKKSIKTTLSDELSAQWKPNKEGEYKAIAIIDYDGERIKTEKTFRVGTLLISIIDYTEEFQKDTINPFNVEIKSGWNNKILNAYAEIIIYNNEKQIASIKTPGADIAPWGKETLTAYWDTNALNIGDYNANITLYYVGKTTEKITKVKIVEKLRMISPFTITYIILAICFVLIFWYFKRKKIRKLIDY